MVISQQDILTARQNIILAKRLLDKGDYDSVHLANYVLRDLEATKAADLSELSWTMHRGNLCKNDVLGIIEYLERFLDREEGING